MNCIALGHKSGRVMVTGGDDKKVNMWCVGKPNCIMVGTCISFQTVVLVFLVVLVACINYQFYDINLFILLNFKF